jgi:predicted metal-dependent enzyme (double-stranded beta helix superfamily)
MRAFLVFAFTLVLAAPASAHDATVAGPDSRLQAACEATLAEARAALERHGVSDSAMVEIGGALARLAAEPSLKDHAKLEQIHGSASSSSAVLASMGDDSLSLFLSRFEPGHGTPVHDHQTWGVLYVLEGRDRYVHWSVSPQVDDHARAEVREATGTILVPGACVYWFPPPHDLHSQQALEGTVWELLVAGRNFLSSEVIGHRHYFDPKTGSVTKMPQK